MLRRMRPPRRSSEGRADACQTARRRQPARQQCVMQEHDARRVAIARQIWDGAADASGTPVVAYLLGRGISITPPQCLRWAPALRCPDGTVRPAMLARIDARDGAMIGISRTWLVRDAAGNWRRR